MIAGVAAVVAVVGIGLVGSIQIGSDDDLRVATDPGPVPAGRSEPGLVAGRYVTEVAAGAVEDGLAPGAWTATLEDDGTLVLEAPPAYTGTRSALFRVTATVFETDLFSSDLCSGLLPGRYRWARTSSTFTLTTIEEPCAPRERLLTAQPWAVATG